MLSPTAYSILLATLHTYNGVKDKLLVAGENTTNRRLPLEHPKRRNGVEMLLVRNTNNGRKAKTVVGEEHQQRRKEMPCFGLIHIYLFGRYPGL